MTISIIVPMYYGRKYINNILNQIEECAKNIIEEADVELILYNDSPEEEICLVNQDYAYKIRVFNPGINSGIHGARVNGLEYATGEYVLFLDQDDYIRPDYIQSQLLHIGDADAVVCKLLNGDKQHYTDSFKFEEVITKEFMLNHWCPIVSPGQVLMRKEAIPRIWIENIIRVNGADDYFLWLAMMGEGKRFALNEDILFEHRITGTNTSMNTNMMIDSEKEMIKVLLKADIFRDSYQEALLKLENSLRRVHIKQLENINVAYSILNILYEISSGLIYEVLGEKVAIYGAADIGMAFYKGIKKNKQLSICFIDRNAKYISTDIPVYHLHDAPVDIDTIVIAVNGPTENIKNDILQRYQCQVLSIDEVVQKVNSILKIVPRKINS